jgi:hypothetical protein
MSRDDPQGKFHDEIVIDWRDLGAAGRQKQN